MYSHLGHYWRRIKRLLRPSQHRPLLDHAIMQHIADGNHDMVALAECLGMTPVDLYFSVRDPSLRTNIRARLPEIYQSKIQQTGIEKIFGKE